MNETETDNNEARAETGDANGAGEDSLAAPAREGKAGLVPEPDRVEEADADEIDDPIPTGSYQTLPLVGLGGSAGSIAALETFFRLMPADSGLVFAVILHLAPDRDSALTSVIQRVTAMPVTQVTAPVKAEPNAVYMIPPGKLLTVDDGMLQVEDLPIERGRRVAVDLFFRTLADTHGAHAAAVVLSGADGDGAIGIKRIKERGGLTVAQDPDDAEQAGMPSAAIATGMVDWVLRVQDMPQRLVNYFRQEKRAQLPAEQGPQPARPNSADAEGDVDENALREVLSYLNARTSRDFTYYKRATILRRIGRRMQVNEVDTLPDYLGFLRTHAGEVGALLQDLLISVTNFFRDGSAFIALEQQLSRLFEGKSTSDTIRVWVPACATGEEAYSIAILLAEHAQTLEAPPSLQVFATDLDEEVIDQARDALFPAAITADVSELRLRRYFVREHRGYRVRREIRELVLFALHDLLKDAPFSRLDLVSCRNLLIYLDREAQKRAIDVMAYSLRPDGLMFLGASESLDEAHRDRFETLDNKHRIYRHKPGERGRLSLPTGRSVLSRSLQMREAAQQRPTVPPRLAAAEAELARRLGLGRASTEASMAPGELHFKLIDRFAPPSLVVDADHEIVHLSHSATRFLEFSGGTPTKNLLHLVQPNLRIELRAALSRAAESGRSADVRHLPLDLQGEPGWVDVEVHSAADLAPGYMLVTLRWHAAATASEEARPAAVPDAAAQQLERELESTRGYVRAIAEQSETAQEELKASNEELQAMNEELRSATEELETSREELQSINEELTTVNQELKANVEDLAHANGDLQNLMAATAIATIFLDRDLHITRYTPPAVDLFKLIATDVGRPLTDLKSQLDYPELSDDARRALVHLVPTVREVQSEGRWFLARAVPYRTVDDRIAGVVLTFTDISDRREAENALRDSETRFRTIVSQASAGVCHGDLGGRITLANARFCDMTGYADGELAAMSMLDVTHPDDQGRVGELFEQMARDGQPFEVEMRYLRKDGRVTWVSNAVTAVRDGEGRLPSAVSVALDITERKLAEEALRLSNERMRRATAVETVGIEFFTRRGRVTDANESFLRMSGYSRADIEAGLLDADTLTAPEARPLARRSDAELAERGRTSAIEIESVRKDGSRWWALRTSAMLGDDEGVAYVIDITANKQAEHALRMSDQRLRLVVDNAREYAILSTDLERYVTTWNSGAEQIFGFSQQEAIGTRIDRLFTPEARDAGAPEAEVRMALDTGRGGDEREHVRRDGTRMWVSGAMMPILDPAGHAIGFVKILRDQTQARAIQESLEVSRSELIQAVRDSQEARVELEDANAAKDQFLAVLSHELRTPLTPVAMAAYALGRLEGLPEKAGALLAIIQRNVRIETHLIDDLLDLTRVSRRQLEVARKPMDLHDAIRGALEISEADVQGKRQRLEVALEAASSQVDGDVTRLKQALWNLLKNASKFTPAGGRIRISTANVDSKIEVRVEDNGAGIDAKAMRTIFDAFSQGSESVAREFGGLGLGLSIARATVNAHGGVLRAESPGIGLGAIFTMELDLL